MASIINRAGKWLARVRKAGYPPVNKTFDSKREAQLWADATELVMDRGEWIPHDLESEVSAKRMMLGEGLDAFYEQFIKRRREDPQPEFLRIERLKQSSLAQYRLSTLRKQHVSAYILERMNSVGPDSVRLDLALLSKFYNYAISNWGMDALVNPVKGVTKPKPSPGRERRLEPGEEVAMIANLNDRYATVMCWALETAMRREEIERLLWEDINLRLRRAIVRKGKNGKRRTIPLSRIALQILELLPHRSGSVFGVSADNITQEWARARARAGIVNLRFHDLRHEAISRLFENTDLDLMEIRVISGHESLSMLARYTHLRAANLADRLDGLPRGHGAKAGDYSAPVPGRRSSGDR